MTEERLKFLEAHFRNPHSAGGLSEYGLELVAALRETIRPAFGIEQALQSLEVPAPMPTFESIPHDAPTPPHGVDRKKGKR